MQLLTRKFMKTQYGDEIKWMMQGRMVYSVPNHGQIDRAFNEQCFYEYILIDSKGIDAGITVQLDVEAAARFAKNNNLTIVKDRPVDLNPKPWAWLNKNEPL